MSDVTAALSVHLNLNQTMEINRTSIYFSLEKLERIFLFDRLNNSQISLPDSIDPILIRVRFSSRILFLFYLNCSKSSNHWHHPMLIIVNHLQTTFHEHFPCRFLIKVE